MTGRLLCIGLLLVATSVASTEGESTQIFDDPGCGIRFEFPLGWYPKVATGEDVQAWDMEHIQCRVGLQPRGWTLQRERSDLNLPRYAVNIVVVDLPFRAVARTIGFRTVAELRVAYEAPEFRPSQAGTEWLLGARQSDVPAYDFVTACCQAVRGVTWGHERAKNGSDASVSIDIAVLNDREGHSVVVYAEEDFKNVLDQVEISIRFVAAPN